MAFSSVSVVVNSLRLKGKKIQRKTEVPPAEKEVVPINEVEPINKENMKKNFKVEGMMCTGCENRIQNAVKNMNGIKSVKADHTTGTVKIEAEDGIEESKIKEKIENIGFDVK